MLRHIQKIFESFSDERFEPRAKQQLIAAATWANTLIMTHIHCNLDRGSQLLEEEARDFFLESLGITDAVDRRIASEALDKALVVAQHEV